ncbi:transposase [Coraliomargarita sp. SDUM461003]|uniref:Transposase n=1 Tax=Thalassobacterium maritimum TaxID=3041265 RepID=A0ABU1AZ75_9BACT|nr:transposase [Coraliomargarita sp. SDUM461003]MDQ8209440.1 transposase [Coraliomargarita sp. SDUM461003]
MARKVRIEYAGAFYHVINRGNYRSWIFESAGARVSFLECLSMCCRAMGWRLHSWCLMSNHYHLLIETPEPNLVEGMKWLQSTFANRFNRFRKAHGHVFQGRYQAILLDADAIGPVAHYIHLNPVRAGLVDVADLQKYEASSFSQLWHMKKRWSFSDFECCLDAAGGLADTPRGRRLYRDYLGWLCSDDSEQTRMGFEEMCRGWAKGSVEFKKSILKDHAEESFKRVVESEAKGMREPFWESLVKKNLKHLGKTPKDLISDKKGALWKVALARYLREQHLVPNGWLSENLSMGTPNSLSSQISRHRKQTHQAETPWRILVNQENVD